MNDEAIDELKSRITYQYLVKSFQHMLYVLIKNKNAEIRNFVYYRVFYDYQKR